MTYVLTNKKNGNYFVRENKYGVCIETNNIDEAAKFNSLSLASYKECLLRDKYDYKIEEI
jgi:hypothetical protein